MNSTETIFDASNLREHYNRSSSQRASTVVIPEEIQIDIRKIARHGKVPVVISGETGTGKEEVAKLIHRSRVAISGPLPFVPVNCANIHGDTAVSVLFGHKKGAFTGATQDTSGFVSDASGGILFLDEIHCLTIDCQQRLLRIQCRGASLRGHLFKNGCGFFGTQKFQVSLFWGHLIRSTRRHST